MTDVRTLHSTDGHVVFAEASGDHSNPHVVLLHGLAVTGAVFDEFCQRQDVLEALYIVRYDLRGHGRSGMPMAPEKHESRLYADDFKTVVDAFKLHRPVLVGWSMGGITGSDIAAHLPNDTISGIFYLSAIPSGITIHTGAATPTLQQIFAYHANPSDIPRAIVEFADACIMSPSVPQPLYQHRCLLAGAMALQPAALRGVVLTRQQNIEPLHNLLSSGLPALLMYGTDDKFVNGKFVEDELRKHAKSLEVSVVPAAGHCLFWEQSDNVASTLLKFVSRVKN